MIYLLRHGLDDENYIGGWSEVDVINEGKMQIYDATQFLKQQNFQINKIFTSDVKRAITTANIVAKELNVEVIKDSNLRELNKGDLNGMLKSEAIKNYPQYLKEVTIDTKYPNGESMQEFYQRVKEYLPKLYELDNNLIVTHRGVINMLYFILNNIDLDMNKEQFNVTHGSIHKLDIKENKIERIY